MSILEFSASIEVFATRTVKNCLLFSFSLIPIGRRYATGGFRTKRKKINLFTIMLLAYIFFGSYLSSQTNKAIPISFQPTFGSSNLNLTDSIYKLQNGDTIRFESLKFYVSGIEFLHNEEIVCKEEKSFHLIDASNEKSLNVSINIPAKIIFNKLKFNLGIDSTTNVSGAMGGDLDPTKGMYWTWQSGYINFKLEGNSPKCKTRNNEFQFHLGGYQSPFPALRKIILNVDPAKKINIAFDLKKFISEIDLTKQNQIMSPGKEAVLLSEKISKLFSIQQQ